MQFKLKSEYKMISDQENAVKSLFQNIKNKEKYQTLLGTTGSGKTFTVANLIEKLQKPTLIISHNKTLAAQLYQEMRDLFPQNAVSYFVSYYDYYQPESYIPSTDTYIEKDSDVNDLIDKLRLSATTNLLTRKDTIVVASVSCIYNIGSPKEYKKFIFEFGIGQKILRKQILDRLLDLQYTRSEFKFIRGTFRVRGGVIDIYPAYMDTAIRIELGGDVITNIQHIDPVSGEIVVDDINFSKSDSYVLYPAKHFIADTTKKEKIFETIKKDLILRVKQLQEEKKLLEAQRLSQRVTYDLEMIKEFGYVKGIENYSRYFDKRNPGETPFSLLDFYKEKYINDWLVIVDESHMTFPQIRGMYAGDMSRKKTLIDYGFRLPAALDNRPLRFDEFMRKIPNFVALSATPNEFELSLSKGNVIEQLIRPTGIPDPLVTIKPTKNQVSDVIAEIQKEVQNKKRVLVTTLTKKTAEDLSDYLKNKLSKKESVAYLHSDIDTLQRTDILDKLRKGDFDVLVGINLLREGLDLPEVGLVAILDADKEGFLRSKTSLIQTMGRAARHVEGRVIMYADNMTKSIKEALFEVERRRKYQIEYNKKHNIIPKSISKPIRSKLAEENFDSEITNTLGFEIDVKSLTPMDRKDLIKKLKKEMLVAAQTLNFELAAEIRDKIKEIE